MASDINVEIVKPRLPSRSAHRISAASDFTVEGYFRDNAFVPAIDAVLANLRDRFGVHQRTAFLLTRLLPKNVVSATWGLLEPAFKQYGNLVGDCVEQQRAELRVWTALWSKRLDAVAPMTAIGTLNECDQQTFLTIHQLLRVLAVLHVTTAEAERLFSKVTRTLTALRSTMAEDRLEAVTLLQAHREKLPATDEVVDRFATSGARRLSL